MKFNVFDLDVTLIIKIIGSLFFYISGSELVFYFKNRGEFIFENI